jgi:hypothetical protein
MEHKKDKTFRGLVQKVIKEMKKEKLPVRLRKEIYKYNNDCSFATNEGTRCSKAFRYTDNTGNNLDCTEYCMNNCKKWINDVIDMKKMPTKLIIDGYEFIVSKIEIYLDQNIYEYIPHKWKVWGFDKFKNISEEKLRLDLCEKLSRYHEITIDIFAESFNNYNNAIKHFRENYNFGDETNKLQLINDAKEKWFTPKWKYNSITSHATIRFFKSYKFT